MPLNYLIFDTSDDGEGTGTWDAMASVAAPQRAAVHAEIAAVLAWAHRAFAGERGPLDDGGRWDYDLQETEDTATPWHLAFDDATGQLNAQAGRAGVPRHTVTLSISGDADFGAALRERFALD